MKLGLLLFILAPVSPPLVRWSNGARPTSEKADDNKASASLWETFEHTPSLRQRVFMRYLTATLVDLAVLGLFAEYWEYVSVDSFTVMLLAAVLLQVLLKLTIVVEHRVAAFFNARPGGFAKFMRYFAPGWCCSGPSSSFLKRSSSHSATACVWADLSMGSWP